MSLKKVKEQSYISTSKILCIFFVLKPLFAYFKVYNIVHLACRSKQLSSLCTLWDSCTTRLLVIEYDISKSSVEILSSRRVYSPLDSVILFFCDFENWHFLLLKCYDLSLLKLVFVISESERRTTTICRSREERQVEKQCRSPTYHRGKYCGKGGDSDLLDARGELLLKGVGSTPCICLGMVFLIMSVMVHGEILNLAAFATTDLCELVYVALGISITVYF